jgi:AcrR family transcriptional regulator
MDDGPMRSIPTLAEEKQAHARMRIRQAATEVVARQGFGATVEEIAERSGVSPRTIFRHYASHDHLMVAVAKEMFEACGRRPFGGVVSPAPDLRGWLESLALAIHSRNVEILGLAFWDVHAPSLEDSEVLTEVAALRRAYRRGGVAHLTAMAWKAAGGTGAPTEALRLTFALNFSAFTTQALMIDFDQTPAQVAAVTADILMTVLQAAVETSSRA